MICQKAGSILKDAGLRIQPRHPGSSLLEISREVSRHQRCSAIDIDQLAGDETPMSSVRSAPTPDLEISGSRAEVLFPLRRRVAPSSPASQWPLQVPRRHVHRAEDVGRTGSGTTRGRSTAKRPLS